MAGLLCSPTGIIFHGIRRVAVRAAEIAADEPHENVALSRPRPFSLDGRKDLVDRRTQHAAIIQDRTGNFKVSPAAGSKWNGPAATSVVSAGSLRQGTLSRAALNSKTMIFLSILVFLP